MGQTSVERPMTNQSVRESFIRIILKISVCYPGINIFSRTLSHPKVDTTFCRKFYLLYIHQCQIFFVR